MQHHYSGSTMKPASAKCSQPEMPTVEFAKKQLTEVKIRKEFKAVWGSDCVFIARLHRDNRKDVLAEGTYWLTIRDLMLHGY
jgi:hypothetical protein